jgi:hypothetical protein
MEPFSYINAPIDPKNVAHIQEIMEEHGATLRKIRPDVSDHWWTIFLPEGTRRVEQAFIGEVPKFKITFPDGYSFLFAAGIKNRYGLFIKNPVVYVNSSEES